ncbi:hypothetical protein AVEN_202512-1 [Araneus ventricosus]|uniref:Uncharacterized protein n=1 Tax=Araneus ventricosus TaxID=182803 RepID=A0A4Y2T2R5_ARAVE|nr:hypothetical protein AVEN_14445-1 [Araneus ventricosus]GBO21878.1 hypothetical protein AVEN_237830-1 [Araneus ventricosus]GBO21879.1 hypothetical protein AVEN_133157-1 [Araneus ventricosus]GBO21884.1 hypothetical protein AVEN_151778-1 [Araneus ventricosus]GBO21886.1 hypothetical protein AVEN_202512-1 [Araneus ventricosus]
MRFRDNLPVWMVKANVNSSGTQSLLPKLSWAAMVESCLPRWKWSPGHAATTLQLLAARLGLLSRGKEAERFPSLSVSSEMTNHRE